MYAYHYITCKISKAPIPPGYMQYHLVTLTHTATSHVKYGPKGRCRSNSSFGNSVNLPFSSFPNLSENVVPINICNQLPRLLVGLGTKFQVCKANHVCRQKCHIRKLL